MNLGELILVNIAVTSGLMLALWAISVALRDVSIVDVFWGPGFVVIAGLTFALSAEPSPRRWPLLILTAAWGTRLAVHLGRRKFGTPEDYRYREMRQSFGPRFWLVSLGVVFGLQAAIMNLVAMPLVVGQLDPAPLGAIDALGVAVWCVGFAFESIGDRQLARFKANPQNRGKALDRGLWAYTRHPNYFGDFLVWWGFFLIALGSGSNWWIVVSPVAMSFLLLKVSGVALLERSLRASNPDYAAYVSRTSSFFPWPPRGSRPLEDES